MIEHRFPSNSDLTDRNNVKLSHIETEYHLISRYWLSGIRTFYNIIFENQA